MAVSEEEKYWRSSLEGLIAPTSLVVSLANTEKAQSESTTAEISYDLEPDLVSQLNQFVVANDLRVGDVALLVWALLLHRYSREEDIVFGVCSEQLSGVYPLRIQVTNSSTPLQLVGDIKQLQEEIQSYSSISPAELQQLSSVPEDLPLFESVVCSDVTCNYSEDSPLFFNLDSRHGAYSINIRYQTARFEESVVLRMQQHLGILLDCIIKIPKSEVGTLSMLTDDEKKCVIEDFNNTQTDFPSDKCMHELFEEQVRNNPSAVAAVYEAQQLTYAELNVRANKMAHYLRSQGVGVGKLVGISMGRGLDMIVGIMGIIKSGAAYVPLDPDYPLERLSFMIEDSGIEVLLTQQTLIEDLFQHKSKVVLIDADWPEIAKNSDQDPISGVTPTDLLYIIYTSGSTGLPKGAVLNHRGRVNNFYDFNTRFSIRAGDHLLALASISFDMSAYDIMGTLACGATIVVADSLASEGPSAWARLMLKHQITVWHSVPALLGMLVDYVEERPELYPHSLRLVLLGGDWIPVSLPDRLKAIVEGVRVISMGGATEVSMDSTIYEIQEKSTDLKSISYGAPMANQLTYVLDQNLQPVPIGIPGELHLGGVGVGEGYHNRPELTAEKFIPNPFKPEERMYKTGDLVRFGEDGNLELLGRIDFQVKIRGFRVELGEIESTLRKHPAVKECVLMAKQDVNNDKKLVAYVLQDMGYTGTNGSEPLEEQLSQWQSVYDSAYSKESDQDDKTFNIVSWDSSYTEQPYPADVMREWVDATVRQINEFNPKRVLEIGCGTGLLLFRVASACSSYIGTDISPVALQHVSSLLKQQELQQVSLYQRSAEDFSDMQPDSVDTVVLNSIVMDFPSLEYLTEVLKGAARVTAPGGIIFVGDVRNNLLSEAFHASVQFYKARSSLDCEQLKQHIKRQMNAEEEMLIDPAYFVALAEHIPEICHVEVMLKQGADHNEMTKFRYNVVLHIGDKASVSGEIGQWQGWDRGAFTLEKLRKELSDGIEQLGIQGIPNARLSNEYQLLELLAMDGAGKTIRELRKLAHQKRSEDPGVDPEAFWRLGDELGGYDVKICYAQSGSQAHFDVVFIKQGPGAKTRYPLTMDIDSSRSLYSYSNDPATMKLRRKLTVNMRRFLNDKLPSYMVPSAFVILDEFPLSPNGKLNRKALPEPDSLRPDLENQYVAPRNDLERVITDIWSQCLGLDNIGINDGFIALGGNSLLATQVVSQVRDIFQLELPLNYCINCSIAELSERAENIGRDIQIDVRQAAEVYIQINQMSESDVKAMLSA